MTKYRSHSAAFKRQVAEEFIAGETLHALAQRHDISRQLIRIWVSKFEGSVAAFWSGHGKIKAGHGKTASGGHGEAGRVLQGTAIHRRGDPLGGPLVPDVPISYRDLELMLADRGMGVEHTTIFRWIQAYAPAMEQRTRPHLRPSNGSWRVDETYVKVKGRWTYLYRAVDSRGQTIDFLLSAKRDAAAAKRFFRKALGQPHTVNPRTITVDKNPAYPRAVAEMKEDGELWRRSRLRQVKYLNNIVEQDHRRVKRLIRPGLGFGSFWTARRTLAGYEVMAMVRKGQVRRIGGRDMRAQAAFVATLFHIAA